MEEKWEYETNDHIHPPVRMQGEGNPPGEPDWNDDSGAIHTAKQSYHITKEDGWQRNRGYDGNMRPVDVRGARPQRIKGTQVGISYTTDDYRVVIPVLIVLLLIMAGVCAIVTYLIPLFGIFFDVIFVLAVIGIVRQRPDKKWRAQAKRLKEEKESAKRMEE